MHRAGMAHAGIVYCRQQSRTVGEMVRMLGLLWKICEATEMHNRLEYT
jgi:hypothetical protein